MTCRNRLRRRELRSGASAVSRRGRIGPRADAGSGSVYVLVAATAVLALGLAIAAVGDAVVARHRAESLADLAAIAAASAQQRGGDGCASGAAFARSERGRVVACRVEAGGAVDLTVTVPAGPVLARFGLGVALARARAGPAPAG